MSKLDDELREWRENDASRWHLLTTWSGSTLLHLILFLVLVWMLRPQPLGVVEEPARTTGIVLKAITPEGRHFEGPRDDVPQDADSADATAALAALPNQQQAPVNPSDWLPDRRPGAGPPPSDAAVGGGNVNISGAGPGRRNIDGGQARTSIFGIPGEGFKFVYVFDASSSMEGRPLTAAKRELLASLESLDRVHQFQIIFYNNIPSVFSPSGVRGKLNFATEANKESARNYIGRITAQNITMHEPALKLAVDMQPDVIFFLTDGEESPLLPGQLRRLRRANRGEATIHVIQFGLSPPTGDNWLKQLARENRGQYQFFNTRDLVAP
ncbi:MAG: VWA domain-containing protein [Planctomycetota bacterium]|nr:MAG: VWA domain-containing protein [Planctomycetota bacterium]REJ95593.1 MAG: VWA domain-containing protein [Planctomycetota bacterium]REK22629.1 MAG: VWA domain-containing protein [Planctomycetota bacterium]REK48804.1 MAG: VWA domain-containing protein [Planctomycetota bacterium]